MSKNYFPWIQIAKDAALRLVCFPYAGGGSAVYHRWRPYLPRSVDLLPICLAGRESRIDEPPATDLNFIAREIATDLEPYLDRPWAVVGHSMGAWLGFEVIRDVRRRGSRMPSLFIAAASRTPPIAEPLRDSDLEISESLPHLSPPAPLLHSLPDDEFLATVRDRYDGIPPSIAENPDLLRLLLPALRADIQMVETYQAIDEPPLDVEILALGGTDDRAVSASDLAAWRRLTTNRFSSRLIPGGHFFLFRATDSANIAATDKTAPSDRPSPALAMIIAKLEQFVPPSQPS